MLIKHHGSRCKASWKDPEGQVISNTTREAAVSQLKTLRESIVSGRAKFEDVATRWSDCSSAKRGGDLDLAMEQSGESTSPMISTTSLMTRRMMPGENGVGRNLLHQSSIRPLRIFPRWMFRRCRPRKTEMLKSQTGPSSGLPSSNLALVRPQKWCLKLP